MRSVLNPYERSCIDDMIMLIKSNQYDVVTGMINDELICQLIKSDLDVKIVLYAGVLIVHSYF